MRTLSIFYRGRLGNQLFQLAAGLTISRESGRTLVWRNNEYLTAEPYETIMKFPVFSEHKSTLLIEEKQGSSIKNFVQLCNDALDEHITLKGYFQSQIFVKGAEETLKQIIKINNNEVDFAAVHVRRGDYLLPVYKVFNVDFHVNCQNSYYNQAIKKFPKVMVFSDDIEWCKQLPVFKDCSFAPPLNSLETLNLMSRCKGIATANSSYSLMAACLMNSKYPKFLPCTWYNCFRPSKSLYQLENSIILSMCDSCKNSHHPCRCNCKK